MMANPTGILLAAVASLMITSQTFAVEFGEHSWNIDVTYLASLKTQPLGSATIFSGYGTKSQMYQYGNTLAIDIVDGVRCVRSNWIRTEKAELFVGWFAQDINGDVYLLKYWDGENPTPVVLGKNGALLFMPRVPKVGDTIEGDKIVIETGVTVPVLSTGLGPYTNCLKTVEDDGDIVYFAPGMGEVKKEYLNEQGGYELKEVIPGSGYSTIDDTLKITVNGLWYKGMKLDATAVFEYVPNSADPSGFYWKLAELY